MAVEFEEPKYNIDPKRNEQKPTALMNLMMRFGFAKNPSQANVAMIIITILCIIVAIILIKSSF